MNRGEFVTVKRPWDFGDDGLQPMDILDDGSVVKEIEYPGGMWLGPCKAVVVAAEVDGRTRCLWRPEWMTVRNEPLPMKPVRVLRGAGLPGYVCTDPVGDELCDACPLR